MTETLPWPIPAITEWMPFWKAAGFFLATFVLEDLAAIGAGFLLATHSISWPVAFLSCFLGIWLGDAGLYALARFGGRKWFAQSSFKKYSSKVARGEKWFEAHGTYVLVFSRCVPGARLPTYLAAGFLRAPLPGFLAVTAAAAFVWTFIILWLAETVGVRLVHWINVYKHGALLCLGFATLLFAGFHLLRRVASAVDFKTAAIKLERWRRWEFWPAWLFYPPVAVYYLWLAIRHRGLAIPTAANPGIYMGGLVGESKIESLKVLAQTSPEFTAVAGLIAGQDIETRRRSLEAIRERHDLQFPFILKPDLGQRGAGVKLIRTPGQMDAYLQQPGIALLAQRYAPGPCEVGIFYYRLPSEAHGRIFAITEKIFPVITGDGCHTIAELIGLDSRARLIAATYRRRFGRRWNEIPPSGEAIRLVEAGNHAQGCIFRDGQRLWSRQLEARIDEISQKLNGFFIGRYDIRYADEADLMAGRNFQIVELNGAAAEATSIYDARNSLWLAYQTLFRQWELVFAIGSENIRNGVAPSSVPAFLRAWRAYLRLAETYPTAD